MNITFNFEITLFGISLGVTSVALTFMFSVINKSVKNYLRNFFHRIFSGAYKFLKDCLYYFFRRKSIRSIRTEVVKNNIEDVEENAAYQDVMFKALKRYPYYFSGAYIFFGGCIFTLFALGNFYLSVVCFILWWFCADKAITVFSSLYEQCKAFKSETPNKLPEEPKRNNEENVKKRRKRKKTGNDFLLSAFIRATSVLTQLSYALRLSSSIRSMGNSAY